METWRCPDCGEEFEAPGPTSLQMQVDEHSRTIHDGKPFDITGFSWLCPYCPELIRRASETNLKFAKIGHLLYTHRRDLNGSSVPSPQSYSSDNVPNVKSEVASGDEPWTLFTKEDLNFLETHHIRWSKEKPNEFYRTSTGY